MIFKANFKLNTLIFSVLSCFININKPSRDFFMEIMFLFLGIKGRLNFSQFGRYGNFSEQRYRQQFEKPFDFLSFNKNIVISYGSGDFTIAFDPSFIDKSGKKTPGLGVYWSGVAGRAKLGLEIGGIAAVDMGNKTSFHLEAIQTLNKDENMSLLDWYAEVIIQRKDHLLSISKYVVADAYFSKESFTTKILDKANMHLISRLRKDSNLMYLFKGKQTGKRGRPKKYAGKIDLKNVDMSYFDTVFAEEKIVAYSAIVYSNALKRNIKLVCESQTTNEKQSFLLFFSTDLELDALKILNYYKKRFQIEFLYRDGKQHTGLNDCQARSENKLHFHFNASLTAINLAKVEHWLSVPKETRGAFSMADAKTMYNNALMLERFIRVFAIRPNKLKNNKNVRELLNFGKIAA
jgi:Transposase DDE domain